MSAKSRFYKPRNKDKIRDALKQAMPENVILPWKRIAIMMSLSPRPGLIRSLGITMSVLTWFFKFVNSSSAFSALFLAFEKKGFVTIPTVSIPISLAYGITGQHRSPFLLPCPPNEDRDPSINPASTSCFQAQLRVRLQD